MTQTDPNKAHTYEARVMRVMDHIHDHLDGDLSLDALSDVAAMSRFHWHRVYHGMTGETCADTVRRARLHRAACWLVQTDWDILKVVKKAGFKNRNSFQRIFRESYGMTPSAFRATGQVSRVSRQFSKRKDTMFDVEIKNHEDLRMAAVAHKGSYQEINHVYGKLGAMLGARGLLSKTGRMAGVYYDDPSAVAVDDLRSHGGFELDADIPVPEDAEEITIEGGKTAVLKFKGPYANLHEAYTYLFGEWLPASGEVPRDHPSYELYLNTPVNTPADELLTEICLPLV